MRSANRPNGIQIGEKQPPKPRYGWAVARATFCCLLFTGSLLADDWPQWRGANRDGVWNERGVVSRFESDELKPVWTTPVGPGYSGPTVVDNRVFLTDRQATNERKQQERVLCFDAKSGQKLWEYAYECKYSISFTAGPRASVTVDDNRAFALGAMGHLHCLDVGGALLWKHNLDEKYQLSQSQRMPIWGIASAPLVVGRLVIIQVGGKDNACIVAFDKKSGEEVWRALRDRASYSAPILLTRKGRQVVVCLTGDSVAGLDPLSGEVLWRSPFAPKKMPISVATPVISGDNLLVTSFYDGSLMLKLNADGSQVQRLWRRVGRSERDTDALHCMISTPWIEGKHFYGVDSYGELRCLETASGDRIWTDKTATRPARWSNIHIVRNGDQYWLFNESGELIIAELTSSGFHEISRAKIIAPTLDQLRQRGGVCWAHPAYANRHIFIRNDNQLICTSLED